MDIFGKAANEEDSVAIYFTPKQSSHLNGEKYLKPIHKRGLDAVLRSIWEGITKDNIKKKIGMVEGNNEN